MKSFRPSAPGDERDLPGQGSAPHAGSRDQGPAAGVPAKPRATASFEQEARAASALNQPNILTIHDVGEAEQGPYVVSELLEGETLRAILADGKLPSRRTLDYAIQIARGLAAAHEKGIVHRDLKPENLFVTKDGRVKILDFGLAKLTEPETIWGASPPKVPVSGM